MIVLHLYLFRVSTEIVIYRVYNYFERDLYQIIKKKSIKKNTSNNLSFWKKQKTV